MFNCGTKSKALNSVDAYYTVIVINLVYSYRINANLVQVEVETVL